jgi:hypothetical protein
VRLELVSSFVSLVTFALSCRSAMRDETSPKSSLPSLEVGCLGERRRRNLFAF